MLFRACYYAEDALIIKRTASSESNEKLRFISKHFPTRAYQSLLKSSIQEGKGYTEVMAQMFEYERKGISRTEEDND
jgi:hypothetical protein